MPNPTTIQEFQNTRLASSHAVDEVAPAETCTYRAAFSLLLLFKIVVTLAFLPNFSPFSLVRVHALSSLVPSSSQPGHLI